MPVRSPLYRPGDEWDQFCVDASVAWENVTGNSDEATKLQQTCIEKNQKLPCSTFLTPPWTVVGLGCRGLPQNFSSSESKTRSGVTGALVSAGKEAVGMVNTVIPGVIPASGGTTKGFVRFTGTVIGTMPGLVGLGTTPMPGQQSQTPPGGSGGGAFIPAADERSSSNMMLYLLGAGVVGFLLLRKKGGGGMGGFGGYSKRKKSRRVRRRR